MTHETPPKGKALTGTPEKIADPLDAAQEVSDTGKPTTPDTESAKRPDETA
ncbi:hypothetical protein [Arenibaculum pallidiluteum]|uniref:hypothetical protein n=1 Tax=Arenibaculum pallidiluteum TaxID=2812559 RepID=UPI001A9668AC|nr:hypothetical protein [Arenibaculum pallidiluteum]